MPKNKAIIIATESLTTNLLYEALQKNFDISKVIIENKISKFNIIKGRIKKIGLLKTLGQVQFLLFILPFINAEKRIGAIISENHLTGKPIPRNNCQRIKSINAVENLPELIGEAEIIFINGTRIISKKVLNQVALPIINIHVGITPKYRGVHGGYWALYNQDADLFGTTLHYVDAGIDTGGIIAQKLVKPTKEDNFKSYPILQFCAGLRLIDENLQTILSEKRKTRTSIVKDSKLHYHPGIIQYLLKRIFSDLK